MFLGRLYDIDSWIITNVFEPISHRFQRRTGRTCYYLAWWFVGFSILGYFLQAGESVAIIRANGEIPPEDAFAFWAKMFFLPLMLLVLVVRLYRLQKMNERTVWSTVALAETRMPFIAITRVCCVLMMIPPIIISMILVAFHELGLMEFLVSNLGFMCWIVSDYFSACTPLPPGVERQQERTMVAEPIRL